jgi:hypothetical protein
VSVKIKGKFSSLELFTEDIIKTIDRNELTRRKDAAKHAVKVMRDNIGQKGYSNPGGFPARRTGALKRSIGSRLLKSDRSAMVGTTNFKAHLLEYGHGDGKERNKRPFVVPSLEQAEPEIIRIMSREYF